ncbi:GAF domain-containing protein [Nocardia terpenica]|uniref:GAF domain-containing protein n=1 Tax=Nocardia terpenica TaxID=455432 RepID=UPI0023AFE109|nr:GAF domain-containing protein [Nocardia terpenica]
MANDWVLVATLPESEPRIMAIGREPRPLSPLKQLRGATREPIVEAITTAYTSKEPYHKVSRGSQVIAEPFLTPQDIVTGVQAWAGKPEDALPDRLPAGAWVWDIDAGTCLCSPQIHEVYKMPPERALTEITRAQSMFGVTLTADEQGKALQAALSGEVGLELNRRWKIERYDGRLRQMHFSARLTMDRDGRKWLHGITQDVTEGDSVEPDPLTLEAAGWEAARAAEAGAFSAHVDLRTKTVVRWFGTMLPGAQCEMTGHEERDPAIHPEDIATANALAHRARTHRVEGSIRVRDIHGGWMRLDLVGVPIVLDPGKAPITALVKLRIARD